MVSGRPVLLAAADELADAIRGEVARADHIAEPMPHEGLGRGAGHKVAMAKHLAEPFAIAHQAALVPVAIALAFLAQCENIFVKL